MGANKIRCWKLFSYFFFDVKADRFFLDSESLLMFHQKKAQHFLDSRVIAHMSVAYDRGQHPS